MQDKRDDETLLAHAVLIFEGRYLLFSLISRMRPFERLLEEFLEETET